MASDTRWRRAKVRFLHPGTGLEFEAWVSDGAEACGGVWHGACGGGRCGGQEESQEVRDDVPRAGMQEAAVCHLLQPDRLPVLPRVCNGGREQGDGVPVLPRGRSAGGFADVRGRRQGRGVL